MSLILQLGLALLFFFPGSFSWPQPKTPINSKPVPQQKKSEEQNKSPALYKSAEDSDLSIKKILIVPFYDNQNEIYSASMTQFAHEWIESEKQWDSEILTSLEKSVRNEVDSDQSSRRNLLKKNNAQGILTSKIIKGPKGITLKATLYVGPTALPLIEESIDQIEDATTENIKKNYLVLLSRVKNRLPYYGILLSRRGSEVTFSLGAKNGLSLQSEVRVILVLKLNRHPKFNTLVSAEKEILGKIQLTKVDENLSFGTIIYEKEPHLLAPSMKIEVENSNTATRPAQQENGSPTDPHFGEKPKEWLPLAAPQYGKLGLALGIAEYNQSANLTTAGNITASNNFSPSLRLSAEFWLNEDWFINLSFRQSALAVSNGLPNSSPARLNMTLGRQDLSFGYTLLVTNDFFGPKFQFSLGLSQFNAQVDPSSPAAITTMNYGGMALGFLGSFPIHEDIPWDLGARFKHYLWPSTSESPASGSVTSTKINNFGVFTVYKRSRNFNYTAELDFEYYATNFDPTGAARPDSATEISHKLTQVFLGLEYLF